MDSIMHACMMLYPWCLLRAVIILGTAMKHHCIAQPHEPSSPSLSRAHRNFHDVDVGTNAHVYIEDVIFFGETHNHRILCILFLRFLYPATQIKKKSKKNKTVSAPYQHRISTVSAPYQHRISKVFYIFFIFIFLKKIKKIKCKKPC